MTFKTVDKALAVILKLKAKGKRSYWLSYSRLVNRFRIETIGKAKQRLTKLSS